MLMDDTDLDGSGGGDDDGGGGAAATPLGLADNNDDDDWGLGDFDDEKVPPTPKTTLQEYGLGLPGEAPVASALKPQATKASMAEKVEAASGGGSILEQLIKEAKAAGEEDTETAYDNTATCTPEETAVLLGHVERYLRAPLRPMPYQLAWLKFFNDHPNCGGIYADDMGLGKTYSVWLATLMTNPPTGRLPEKKTLLVANNQAVMNQWESELHKFFINLPFGYLSLWSADDRWSEAAAEEFDSAHVILTTKDTLVSDFQTYSPYWMSDHSQNKAGTSTVMYSPVDGEPRAQGRSDGRQRFSHLLTLLLSTRAAATIKTILLPGGADPFHTALTCHPIQHI
jgi:hypothetical protein